jgi:hypothetical protein
MEDGERRFALTPLIEPLRAGISAGADFGGNDSKRLLGVDVSLSGVPVQTGKTAFDHYRRIKGENNPQLSVHRHRSTGTLLHGLRLHASE